MEYNDEDVEKKTEVMQLMTEVRFGSFLFLFDLMASSLSTAMLCMLINVLSPDAVPWIPTCRDYGPTASRTRHGCGWDARASRRMYYRINYDPSKMLTLAMGMIQ